MRLFVLSTPRKCHFMYSGSTAACLRERGEGRALSAQHHHSTRPSEPPPQNHRDPSRTLPLPIPPPPRPAPPRLRQRARARRALSRTARRSEAVLPAHAHWWSRRGCAAGGAEGRWWARAEVRPCSRPPLFAPPGSPPARSPSRALSEGCQPPLRRRSP